MRPVPPLPGPLLHSEWKRGRRSVPCSSVGPQPVAPHKFQDTPSNPLSSRRGRRGQGRGGTFLQSSALPSPLSKWARGSPFPRKQRDPMRLSAIEASAIREEIGRLDPQAEVYLYGSRVDDAARGGDVDLLVVSDTLGFRDILCLRRRILDRIGWQQLDLVVRRRDQVDEPLAAMAQETGIRL